MQFRRLSPVLRQILATLLLVCGIGVGGSILWLGAFGQESAKGTYKTASEIPWAGDLIHELYPEGDLFAEANFYYARNHHFVRACGQGDPAAFSAFHNRHQLDTLSGYIWPSHKNEWITPSMRDRFRFSKDDCVFIGDISLRSGERAEVEGAFSLTTHNFVIEVKSRGGAD